MTNYRKLLSNVEEALELSGLRHFIHKETYELLSYPNDEHSYYADMEAFEDSVEKVKQKPDDYIEIESLSSREAYIIMEDFTDTIHNIPKQDILMKALGNKKPFRQFRTALEYTNLLDEWYEYKTKSYKKLAAKWVDMYLENQQINT